MSEPLRDEILWLDIVWFSLEERLGWLKWVLKIVTMEKLEFFNKRWKSSCCNDLSSFLSWIWNCEWITSFLPLFNNTLKLRQHGSHFPGDIFKCIFLDENVWISLRISLKFVPKVWINNIPALVQIMPWRQPGDQPLSEPMTVSLLMHICVTRFQWDKQCS